MLLSNHYNLSLVAVTPILACQFFPLLTHQLQAETLRLLLFGRWHCDKKINVIHFTCQWLISLSLKQSMTVGGL